MNYSRQRNLVMEVLKDRYDHPTAEMVYERAHKKMPTIGIATIYRNLNQLVEMGEVRRIPQPGGNDRFDARVEEHYHIRCPICGHLTDLMIPEDTDAKDLLDKACKLFDLHEDGKIRLSSVIMERTCDSCEGIIN